MEKRQALTKAMALCSQKEYNEANIRSRLKTWGADANDIDDIIDELIREKFIDDLRYATAYVRDKVRLNQWGRVKIRYMLSMEHIKHSLIDQALAEIDEDEYLQTLQDILAKKSRELRGESNPYQKRQKLVKFAQGRGFEVDLALEVIKEMEGK
jgi:regulatory protein